MLSAVQFSYYLASLDRSALTPPVCNGCLASNDLCMLSQKLLCAPVCRARDGRGWRGMEADCVRPRWLLFAWLCRRIQTRARGRTWVQTSMGVTCAQVFIGTWIVRVYSRAITFVRASARMERWEGHFNIPTVYSSGSVDIGYRRKITSILVNTPSLHA